MLELQAITTKRSPRSNKIHGARQLKNLRTVIIKGLVCPKAKRLWRGRHFENNKNQKVALGNRQASDRVSSKSTTLSSTLAAVGTGGGSRKPDLNQRAHEDCLSSAATKNVEVVPLGHQGRKETIDNLVEL